MSDRLPLSPNYWATTATPAKEFYEKALLYVRRRRGLVHGKFNSHGRVCAVGAMEVGLKKDGNAPGSMTVESCVLKALQAVNDSVPDATPAERRRVVIEWLKNKIESLK